MNQKMIRNKTITLRNGKIKCSNCDSTNLTKIGKKDGNIIYRCSDCYKYPVMSIVGQGETRLPVWSNIKDEGFNPLSKPLIN